MYIVPTYNLVFKIISLQDSTWHSLLVLLNFKQIFFSSVCKPVKSKFHICIKATKDAYKIKFLNNITPKNVLLPIRISMHVSLLNLGNEQNKVQIKQHCIFFLACKVNLIYTSHIIIALSYN